MVRAVATALVLVLAVPAAFGDAVKRQVDLPTNSLFDAQAMGPGSVRFALAAGFPYVQGMAGVGLTRAMDVDFNVDTLYGAATQLGVGPKLRVAGDQSLAFALSLQGQWTGFRNPAFAESGSGARHITGLRDWGLQPSAIVSSRGRSGSIFGVAQVQFTYATEPELSGPLTGGSIDSWGTNLGLYVGGELNSSSSLVHAYGLVGLDLHFREGDSPALPRLEVGFTFPG
ncbi:MAG: hypothetical protein JST54_16280 [Deltaproteobacteria bacterium]|nr:hypothetical protein [Deltaproteobacteria bacterium]